MWFFYPVFFSALYFYAVCATTYEDKCEAVSGILQKLSITNTNIEDGWTGDNYSLACDALKVAFGNNSVGHSDESYESLIEGNWAQNAWLYPKCIVSPTTSFEISIILQILRITDVSFAVRSGGHSPNTGWANIQDGVLIDMHNFDEISYDQESATVKIGTGQRWINVYEALDPYNVTVVGGRVPPVGVGGLVLGGGLSYLTNELGLVADNVENFEVVLASGAIVQANSIQNNDLFWALKGGTSNFGIVTYFTMTAIPAPGVWGGVYTYSYDQAPALLEAIAEYQQTGEKDLKSAICGQFLPLNNTIFLNVIYTAPVSEQPKAFEMFDKIPALAKDVQLQNWTSLLNQAADGALTRWSFTTVGTKANNGTYQESLKILEEETTALKEANGATVVFVVQPISPNVVQQGIKKGGNALGLEHFEQMWFGLSVGWNHASDDEVAWGAPRKAQKRIQNMAASRGDDLRYIFMNDAAYDQDVLQSYGPENIQRLHSISHKYDPTGTFQKLLLGGFKLRCTSLDPPFTTILIKTIKDL